jgi:hypothetical protein
MQPNRRRRQPRLTARQLANRVFRRLAKYRNLSDLEQFAMFMGMAQVVEFGLKQLRIERWTLGRTTQELRNSGLRGDFIAVLEDFVGYRNYIAHEDLANEALLRRIVGRDIGRLERRNLDHAIHKVEQIVVLHDWLDRHGAWVVRAARFDASSPGNDGA